VVLVKHANDVGEGQLVVEEEVADRDSSFALGIEGHSIVWQFEVLSGQPKAITSASWGLVHEQVSCRSKLTLTDSLGFCFKIQYGTVGSKPRSLVC
jgi:hypothetical protein